MFFKVKFNQITRHFHPSPQSLSRWTNLEDQKLLQRYEKIGQAWTVLSLGLNSRSPVECRRRILKLTGQLKGIESNKELMDAVYVKDYEIHNGRLLKIPSEKIVSTPFQRLSVAAPYQRYRSQRKKLGWAPVELLALRQAYEQVSFTEHISAFIVFIMIKLNFNSDLHFIHSILYTSYFMRILLNRKIIL